MVSFLIKENYKQSVCYAIINFRHANDCHDFLKNGTDLKVKQKFTLWQFHMSFNLHTLESSMLDTKLKKLFVFESVEYKKSAIVNISHIFMRVLARWRCGYSV